MDIEMLKILSQAPLSSNRPLDPPSRQDGKQFEQALKVAVGEPEMARAQVAQTVALVELAQLQLLQGLFLEEEESEAAGFLANLNVFEELMKPTQVQQQASEALYQKLQPSLLPTVADDRAGIEKMIDKVAAKVGLAPDLIKSVVTAESAFKPDAVSTAGAQGLMQLMPETAQELGVEDSFDPLQNLLGGSQYLKQLLDKYAGDLDKTLAAYNWGQGNVDRKGLEQMPQETRDYLAKVKGLLAAQV